MSTRQDRHISHFYDWAVRGQGWLCADEPVELEAPFHPFFVHRITQPYTDDGERHTILSSIAKVFKRPKEMSDIPGQEFPPIEPFADMQSDDISIFRLSAKRGASLKLERMEQCLALLAQHSGMYSFEIIASPDAYVFQLTCPKETADTTLRIVRATLPDAVIQPASDNLVFHPAETVIADFGLAAEFMRPLATLNGEHDSFLPLFVQLDGLQQGEQVIMQILFQGTVNAWEESIVRSVTINGKDSFFIDAPEMPTLAKEKIARPLVAATIRIATQARTRSRAEQLITRIADTYIHATDSGHNRLQILRSDSYTFDRRINDVLYRQSHRLGMLINVRELATLAHLPNASVKSNKLHVETKTTAPAPYNSDPFVLGINEHEGVQTPATVPLAIRLQHTHILGATGMGKSTLLHSLICQDIVNGNGVAVIDPHGDLIEQILPCIPKERIRDVVLIDPSDAEYSVGFNLLHAHSELEKELLASDLVALFRRFSTSWGDQMNSVFANAILAILESTQGGTLIDLRRFLIEKSFRERFLETVKDDAVSYYWKHEYPLLKSSSIGSILTRLDTFLRPKLIRNMVSQKQSLPMGQFMDERKIILVKLAQGLIGEENSYLLGATIVAKLQQAAMARQAQEKAARVPFFLYMDEFHHFITPSLSHIISGARKYGLGLIVAHQDMQQVSKHDAELATSLLANAGTRLCFRLGEADAKKLAEGFSSFIPSDFQILARGEMIARIGAADHDCTVSVQQFPIPDTNYTEDIIASSRTVYGHPPTPQTPTDIPLPHAPTQPIPLAPKQEHVLPVVIPHDVEAATKRQEEKRHRHIQLVVKKQAEALGYIADIEHPVTDGKVDVSLSGYGRKIAVEISITTKPDWELHNIKKCLAAGYDTIIVCSEQQQTINAIRSRVREILTASEQEKILFSHPEAIEAILKPSQEAIQQTEKRIKGYRVSVSYESLNEAERMQKEQALQRIMRQQHNDSI